MIFSKVNPKKIIVDHYQSLRDDGKLETSRGDFFVFFVLPLIIGLVCLSILGLFLTEGTITILATSMSIFAALLFNLLLLVYDIVRQDKQATKNNKDRNRALKEIFANISFSILVAITAVVVLLINYLALAFFGRPGFVEYLLNLLVYWLISLFVLTLFMVLKRIHILLSKEFK